MKKITFGIPEKIVPTKFCKGLKYEETEIKYNVDNFKFKETARGCVLELPLLEDEQVFGFGLQLKGFNHKNRKLRLCVNSDPVENTGDSHAPVPFFVTNKGYGIYFDTARYIEAHCGYGKNKNREPIENNTIIATAEDLYKKTGLRETTVMSVEIPVAKGIDIYIFEGENILDVVKQYNMFSGGGCDVPDWGLGIMYRAYAKNTGDNIIELAKYFRENNIPCDIMGLEPGWQSSSYSCSYLWDRERYPNYKEVIKFLKDNDYHINLWEHAFINATSPIYKDIKEYSGDYEVWKGLIPDFATEEAQEIFAKYHKEYLVDLGIDGFKLDECDGSDFVFDWSFPNCTEFPSGMDGEQYHSMFGTLYMQTILKALDGRKTLSEVRNAGALAASYPFVLYSDLYNHKDFIRGIVNSGFSGLLWTAEVRDAKSKKDFLRRLQTNVFSVQCLINAWYCEKTPWSDWDCEDEVRELLDLRKQLVPMLEKAFKAYKETGKPPVRALVCDYTYDKETYSIDDEYIFCDNLIVAPLTEESDTRMVYLPEGNWVDYWNKKPVPNGWFEVAMEQIPVFEKINTSTPGMNYPEKTYGLDVLNDTTRDIKVAFIGGSITQGENYTNPFIKKWQADRTGTITTINAGVGGTGSEYGTLRLYEDVLSKKPDIVFVEFTLNDEKFAEEMVKKNIESIIRQVYASKHQPVVSFIYIPERRTEDGIYKIANNIKYYDEVLAYYGLKGLNAHQLVVDAVDAKTYVWDDFVPEKDVHPNTIQGANITELMYNEFKSNNYKTYVKNICWNSVKGFNAQDYNKPAPVSPLNGSYDSLWNDTKFDDVVTEGYGAPTIMPFDHFMATSKKGATMTYVFGGTKLGITSLYGKNGRTAHYTISDTKGNVEKTGTVSNYISGYNWYENITLIIDDLEDTEHTLKITVQDGTGLFGIGEIWVDE